MGDIHVAGIVRKIIEFNESREGLSSPLIWPCLVGPSSAGKTTLIKEVVAPQLGAVVETVLLERKPEHEVTGLPRVVEDPNFGWATTIAPPTYIHRAIKRAEKGIRTIIFFDELDKVREERLGVLLTLLAERSFEGVKLPHLISFVGAMQPPHPSFFAGERGEAIQLRMCFLPLTGEAAWEALAANATWKGTTMFRPEKVDVPIPSAPREVPRTAAWYDGIHYNLTQPEREMTMYGIFPHANVPPRLKLVDTAITPDEILALLRENISLLENFTMNEVGAVLPELWISEHTTLEMLEEVIVKFIAEGTREEQIKGIEAMANSVLEYGRKMTEGKKDKTFEILKPYSDEEVADALARALGRGVYKLGNKLGLMNEKGEIVRGYISVEEEGKDA